MPRTEAVTRGTRALAATAILVIAGALAACADAGTAGRDRGEALLEKAEQRGGLAVIARLDLRFRPEASLDPAEARRQRAHIQRAQAELIASLEPFATRVTTRYTSVPLVALVVDADGLRYLLRSPLVRRVQENRPEPPS